MRRGQQCDAKRREFGLQLPRDVIVRSVVQSRALGERLQLQVQAGNVLLKQFRLE